MKQELSAGDQPSSSPAARARVTRTRDSTRPESPDGVSLSAPGSKPRLKHSLPDGNGNSRPRRAVLTSKLKLAGDSLEPAPKEREPKIAVRSGGMRTVENYARLRRPLDDDAECKGAEYETDGKAKDGLQRRRPDASEGSVVKDLQSEVSSLRTQLEKLQSLNAVLESRNDQLAKDLSAAEEKIKNLEKGNQAEPVQPAEFKDVRELIAKKLDLLQGKKEELKGNGPTKMQPVAAEQGANSSVTQSKVLRPPPPAPSQPASLAGPPPPPPPPPPRCLLPRTSTMQNANSLVDFYHSLNKRDGKKEALGGGNCSSQGVNNARNSIVDELQNRSAHLLAIKADVEKRGEFINLLIQKVQAAAFDDMEDVLNFVDWLDNQLSVLADERAVLRHFKWPERKADALREAAFEYRDLKHLEIEVLSLEDDVSVPCDASLKKIAALLDKCERSVQRLVRLRDTTKVSYRDCRIPTGWMLDTGIVSKIKMASVKLAKVYMKRVSAELELARHLEKETAQEALLYQGVHFAYRAYQASLYFAGGLDFETMRAFEDLKERAQRLHRRGSRQLLHSATLPN
ncbi:protein CHUP1, chloroplastic [Iris pallida]|uniref:Protein CHUP1, chloroplastic n=1 Tax=Iris pallida TaxID=29817 RepID=A0AAX6FJZ0_IRIPA|nr:protein CHUP1, chloroplastic [Iris pallida]